MESLGIDLINRFNKEHGSNPDKWDWHHISRFNYLPEAFIREFKDKVDWCDISYSQELSEGFIKEFQNKVDWDEISWKQKLSEDFIREFKDKVDWRYISYSQKLSEGFINEFKDKTNWENLLQNKYCPINIRIEYIRKKVTKEDPNIHSIEEVIEKKDNSLEELKKLVGA